MDAVEFVACCRIEKDNLVAAYLDTGSDTDVARGIASLQLTKDQLVVMREVVDKILTDAFYSLLLGLDGSASIGGVQQPYKIYDESGDLIFAPGGLEGEAWNQFHDGH